MLRVDVCQLKVISARNLIVVPYKSFEEASVHPSLGFVLRVPSKLTWGHLEIVR